MNWNKLSMADKAALMRIYIQNGINDLDAMREHYNTFKNGGDTDGSKKNARTTIPDEFMIRPQISIADNTRVQLYSSNLFEQQVQQAIVAEEERKAQAEFERRQARRVKNEAEAKAREAERRAKTPPLLREQTATEQIATLFPNDHFVTQNNAGVVYDKTRAQLEEQAANWGRNVGSVAIMTPKMVSRNPLTAVALGGLGEMAFLLGRYPFTNFRQTLSTAGELLSPSTYTELLGASPVVGNIANTALGADIAYHSIQDLPEAAESFRLNGDLGSGFRLGLDLLGTSPIYSMINKGVGLINNAANTVRSFGFPILNQSTPNTLTRVIGSGTTGLEDAVLTAGYLRGNPNGGITTAKNLNRRYLPKLKQAGASQGLYDRFASNALTEKDYEWLHKNMPENWFIESTPAEEGVVSLKRGVLPQTYEEYLQMYRSNNPQRTNVDVRTEEGLTSEDIAYNWAGENEPTFAVSKDIAKEMGYDYENILNNSLFRGDYAVQIKNARTHGISGNDFPTGAHLDEHWSLKYPMEWNHPDVSFYKAHNIPLFNKKVYTRINPIKELGLDQTVQKAKNARIERPQMTKLALNHDDRFTEGMFLRSALDGTEIAPTVDAHGISKGNELETLENVLTKGFDKNKTLYTAPLAKSKELEGIGFDLGTASTTSYTDGMFILTSKPNGKLSSDGIDAVLINTADRDYALQLQKYLKSKYPKIKFLLYDEAPAYYKGDTKLFAKARKAAKQAEESYLQKLQQHDNNEYFIQGSIGEELPPPPEEVNIVF